MINNRISNILSRIRNTISSTHNGWIIDQRDLYNSKEVLDLLAKLGELGYVRFVNGSWYLNTLPHSNFPILADIKGRSKSGKRMYRNSKNAGKENEIVRTSSGYLTGTEARFNKKGGEIILKIDRKG